MEEEYSDAPHFDVHMDRPVTRRSIRKREQAELDFQRRGMGKTGVTHRPMSDAERMTICMLIGNGHSYEEIGQIVHRSVNSIKAVCAQVKKWSIQQKLDYDWRTVLKEKAVAAIRAGLDNPEDPYKRGNLGVATMKGLGEFEAENSVHIAQMLNSIPEDQRDRYITLDTAGAIDIESTEVPQQPDPGDPAEDEHNAEPDAEDPGPVGDQEPPA